MKTKKQLILDIPEDISSEMTSREIAEIVGSNISTVRAVMRMVGRAWKRQETKTCEEYVLEIPIDELKEMTHQDISDRIGFSIGSISSACSKNNIKLKRDKIYDEDVLKMYNDQKGTEYKTFKDLLFDLYHNKDMTLEQIGDLIGFSSAWVNTRMRNNGIPRRGRGWTKKRLEKSFIKAIEKDSLKKENKDELKRMSTKEVSKKYGVEESTAYRALLKVGIRPKERQETLTPEIYDEIHSLFKESKFLHLKPIGKRYGICPKTVKKIRDKKPVRMADRSIYSGSQKKA